MTSHNIVEKTLTCMYCNSTTTQLPLDIIWCKCGIGKQYLEEFKCPCCNITLIKIHKCIQCNGIRTYASKDGAFKINIINSYINYYKKLNIIKN